MLLSQILLPTLLGASSTWALAPSGPWDAFNFAPTSKTLYATSIRHVEPTVSGSENLLSSTGSATLGGQGAWVTLDFGKEVGGLISMNFDAVNLTSSISLAFTESPMFINPLLSDDSSFPIATMNYDTVLSVPAPLSTGHWTQPAFALRGGFRFLTIATTSDEPVTISNVSVAISFMPHVEDMTAYTGYFYAQDSDFMDPDFLTKLWYAGAYTVQTDTVAINTGRQVPFEPQGFWANNATLGVCFDEASPCPIIVDGAKRDRAVWPGDMGIAVPTQFVSTFDLTPTRNALFTMFTHINPETGALPESGPPLSQLGSDTYHCWTLIGSYNYYLFSGDDEWLSTIWPNFTLAMSYIEGRVDSSGLADIIGLRDWGRLGQGGHNAEANAILYKLLLTASSLASFANDSSLSSAWAANATALKTVFNDVFWMEDVGLYRDNSSTTLTPQDANSFALLYNLTLNDTQKQRISEGLERNWVDLGPVPPELPDTISPFISGFELQAHFEAGNDTRAFDLLHREWGYILYTNLSVESTLVEGLTANGSLYYRYYDGYNDDAAYTSHAHGWSSGPTSALTFYVAGLTVTSPQGQNWALAPHIGGPMNSAQGGFTTGLGWFGVIWELLDGTSGGISLNVTTPVGTQGVFTLPQGINGTVKVNGSVVDVEGGSVPLSGGALNIVVS